MFLRPVVLGVFLGSLVLRDSMGAPAEPKAAAIIGGVPATAKKWPWFVSIKYLGSFRCGGVLIASRLVLLAKHCITGVNMNELKAIVGDHHRTKKDSTEKSVSISTVYAHKDADLSILELSCSVQQNDAVKVVERYTGDWLPDNTRVTVVGLGWTTSKDPTSLAETLQELSIPIAPTPKCDLELGKLKPYEFCAGFEKGSVYINVCHGDSGGPVFYQTPEGDFKLVGIIVRGAKSCPDDYRYAVFIKVPFSSMRAFIEDKIGSLHVEKPCASETETTQPKRSSCFPGNAMVTNPGGERKRMEDVMRGDRVLAMTQEGIFVYSDVIMVMHGNADVTEEFHVIQTGSEAIIHLSAKHLIYTQGHADSVATYKFAQNVQIGDFVFINENKNTTAIRKKVTKIGKTSLQGVFAPVTLEGTIVVDHIVSSCYAYLESQSTCHAVFSPARALHFWMPAALDWANSVPHGSMQDNLHWYPNLVATVSSPALSLVGIWD